MIKGFRVRIMLAGLYFGSLPIPLVIHSVYPTLPVSFGGDTKLLAGVYASGGNLSHAERGV